MGYRLFPSLAEKAMPFAALVLAATLTVPAGAADPKAGQTTDPSGATSVTPAS